MGAAAKNELIHKLISTNKKVVLIVEDDIAMAHSLASLFDAKGFLVYVESTVDMARKRLQIFDYTRTLVDLAFVHNSTKSAAFLQYLHEKYPDIKTVIITNSRVSHAQRFEAVISKDDNLEVIADIAEESLKYDQNFLRQHIAAVKQCDKLMRMQNKLNKINAVRQYTPEEIAAAMQIERQKIQVLAKHLLEVFEAQTRHMRLFLWKEFKYFLKLFKYNMTFAKLRKIHAYYITCRDVMAYKKQKNINLASQL